MWQAKQKENKEIFPKLWLLSAIYFANRKSLLFLLKDRMSCFHKEPSRRKKQHMHIIFMGSHTDTHVVQVLHTSIHSSIVTKRKAREIESSENNVIVIHPLRCHRKAISHARLISVVIFSLFGYYFIFHWRTYVRFARNCVTAK